MRTAITIGIPASGKARILAGPEVPIDLQTKAFKRRELDTKDLVEVQLWESGSGLTKSFDPRKEAARAERRAASAPPKSSPKSSKPPGKPDYAAELAALSDDKLDEVLETFEVDLAFGAARAEKIAAILKKNAELERSAV
jgi:hypothetical protein